MPLSKDPAARAKQLANLKAENSTKHGARSEVLIRAESSEYVAELRRSYPAEGEVWVRLQARRMAKLARLAVYLEGRPSEVLNLRQGKLNPAMAEEESLTRALLADLERAEQRKKDAGGKPAAGLEALRAKGAQIMSDREANGGD
jgi:hypothetical protein